GDAPSGGRLSRVCPRRWLSGEKNATFDSNLRSIASSPSNLNRFTKFSFQIRCASRALAPM
ncbi:hypothetical protein, partial [Bradyrhizobium diazoefficiens]|uniref:hypothetical protein n=1 Tax=Bradyrhizobium diazoefficiens TaxID=1355477 RepID=UPI001AECBEC7